eukprot:m.85846 g.85846  ORF g.85846 m.85846 type:complete len:375 (+) comp14854_c0_seq4:193-1317(+)
MGCCEPTFPGWLDCYRLLRLDGLFDLGFGDFLDAGLCIDNVCLGLDARPAWRAVDHGLQLRAELILQALTMLDQQNMKVVLDGIRNRGFKMRMALVTGRRLGHPPQLQRKFPDMGVDGNDVAAETEHENTGNRLFPNALEAAEKPVHVSVVYVAQKLKRWLHVRQALDNMPLFNQRRTHRPNTLGLDRCKTAATNAIFNGSRCGVQDGTVCWKLFLEQQKRSVRLLVRRILAEDGLDEGIHDETSCGLLLGGAVHAAQSTMYGSTLVRRGAVKRWKWGNRPVCSSARRSNSCRWPFQLRVTTVRGQRTTRALGFAARKWSARHSTALGCRGVPTLALESPFSRPGRHRGRSCGGRFRLRHGLKRRACCCRHLCG